MAFVKLDCGILDSTLWVDRDARDVFVTALLMAVPHELTAETPQINIGSLSTTGWSVPPGWYGIVPAASVGILRRAGIDETAGMAALVRLGEPESCSRSSDYDGRRLVRVDGGFIVLNFQKYRERDYTAADRAARYREKQSSRRNVTPSRRNVTPANRNVTQAEAEAEAEAKRKEGSDAGASPPDSLNTDAWARWLEYRKKIRKPLKPVSVPAAQRKLSAFGSDQAAVVEQSIANGWSGLFALKDKPSGGNGGSIYRKAR